MLVAEHVGKRFEGIAALVDVSVHLDPGELVALIGPNGAGKSTLFGCLSGHIRPDSGRVTMNGHDLAGLPAHERARLGLARTFQRIELFGGLSVRDHLLVAVRAQQGRRQALARPDRPLEAVGRGAGALRRDPRAGRPHRGGRPARRSADPRHRPAGGAGPGAGVPTRSLLFLDEPSSGLDHRETDEVGAVLEHVTAQRGTAILLCEHDVAFVQRLASRAYVLDCGALIAEGPMASVLEDPAVRTAYLGQEAE